MNGLFLRVFVIIRRASGLRKEVNRCMEIEHGKKSAPALRFQDAASFNQILDTNQVLQAGIQKLSEQIPYITEEEYIARILRLFRNAGLDLSEQEFRTLLAMRRQTDQMLLHREGI